MLRQLGREPTPDGSADLFTWWRAYGLVSPFGHAAADEHLAFALTNLASLLTGGRRTGPNPGDTVPWKLADFRPTHGPRPAGSRKRDLLGDEIMTPEETRRHIAGVLGRFGGVDPRYAATPLLYGPSGAPLPGYGG